MHNITQDKIKKTLTLTLSGNVDINQASKMLDDFKTTVSTLNAKDYILIINPESLSASFLIIPILQNFVQLVAELSFKNIFLLNSDKYSALIKQQLASTGVASSLRFAPNVNEVLKNL